MQKLKAKWQILISIFSIIAIILHFALKFLNSEWQDFPLIAISIIGGFPLLLEIILKALRRNLGADILAAIALLCLIYLQQHLAAVLIVFMLASGQVLENYATRKASSALEALAKRVPAIAHRRNNDNIYDININDINIGDEIVIYPHETCPVDGIVIEGESEMDESYLTGEPYHITKIKGSSALSGAINGDNLIVIRAEKLAQDSRYAKIMQVMNEAQNRKPKLMRLADQLGVAFAIVALIFACAVFYVSGDIVKFATILAVATPCPLLIAIPITVIGAISLAAKRSIIIRDPSVLERLPLCVTAIFDKTGTLTYGKPQLIKISTANIPYSSSINTNSRDTSRAPHCGDPHNFNENDVLQKAASLEYYSRHPLSLAIVEKAREKNLAILAAKHISEKSGQGLTGLIAGQNITITSRNKVNSQIAQFLPASEAGLECIVLINNQYAATLHFRDAPRSDSHSFIHHLEPNHNFKKIVLLSGDRSSEVNYLASTLGISEILASQSPEQKLEFVRAETAKNPTLFMGDGINDAPALTAATVGIAFGQNNAITSEAAGAVIMENTLQRVDELLHISIDMRKIALQSAIGGIMLSFVGMYLAAQGLISPAIGALMQEGIDVFAILNALRIARTKNAFSDI